MIEDKRILGVIIGRAGSKGLPGKNAALLAGRPMICYTIDHAQQSLLLDDLVVSTDGALIAAAARSMHVRVIDRPAALAGDTATVDAAVRHAVTTVDEPADIIVILYANVPIRPPDLIDHAVRTLISRNAASVQSYAPVGKHHPYWMSRMDEQGRITPFAEHQIYRRQDLPALFLPDGGVIAVRRNSLFTIVAGEPHAFLGSHRRGIVTEPGSVIDVDGQADMDLAETILLRRAHAHASPPRSARNLNDVSISSAAEILP